jgi:hypothetical protein
MLITIIELLFMTLGFLLFRYIGLKLFGGNK